MPLHVQSGRAPFAEAALHLRALRLAVLPLGGDDGKAALVKGFDAWHHLPGIRSIEKWQTKFATANVGIVCGLSRLVVVDVDDAKLLGPMLERFGPTPLVVASRRGFQLYYRARGGERSRNLRNSDRLDVDIKAGVAVVVVPPSWNRGTGHLYRFHRGDWSALDSLPAYRDLKQADGLPPARSSVQALRRNPEGTRNLSLFDYLRRSGPYRDRAEVEAEALWFNETFQGPPEEHAKVLATAGSVWRYLGKTSRAALPGGQAYVMLPHVEIDAVYQAGGNVPHSLMLLLVLKRLHGGRATRGEPFAIAAQALGRDRVIPGLSNRKAIEAARARLIVAGILVCLRPSFKATNGRYHAALYQLRSLQSAEPVDQSKVTAPWVENDP